MSQTCSSSCAMLQWLYLHAMCRGELPLMREGWGGGMMRGEEEGEGEGAEEEVNEEEGVRRTWGAVTWQEHRGRGVHTLDRSCL